MTARPIRKCIWTGFALFALCAFAAQTKHPASGLVLKVDQSKHLVTVSCVEIPGYMDAMVMTFQMRGPEGIQELVPGVTIDFTMSTDKSRTYADEIRVHPFQSLELDPTQARRLKLMENLVAPGGESKAISPGQRVPDFSLTDQTLNPIRLSQFSGKVVALTFIYTRCPLPDYCFRLSNNFGQLQKRFRTRMGSDLVLLSIVIDPAHDQPAALADYARTWKADTHAWHFLTGPLPEIEKLARGFDMNFYPDEALFVHSFHTVVIDRQGTLAANLEGNSFSAKQLGDLVETVMAKSN
jgi:protein SCO1/2